MPKAKRLNLVLHEQQKSGPWDIDDVDFGLLLGRLGSRDHSGAVRVEFRRTQEIELILAVVLTGAGVLATSYLKTLGSELAKWTVDELKRRLELRNAELKAGKKTVTISRRGVGSSAKEATALLRNAISREVQLELVFNRR